MLGIQDSETGEAVMDTYIYYMTNSGLYFYCQGRGILIDGLYGRGPYQCFSPFPEQLHKDMINRQGIFAHMDALLFTHSHGDHMDKDMISYMEREYDGISFYVYGDSKNTLNAKMVKDGIVQIELFPFTIRMIRTFHEKGQSDDEIFNVENCMMLLETPVQRILLTADAVLGECEIKILKEYGDIDMVFCNPMQLALPEKCEIFRLLCPKRIFIIHLPLPLDDRFSYRALAQQECRKLVINGVAPEIPVQLSWIDEKIPGWF